MQRFPVIIGPTAGEKSALARALVHALATGGRGAEIVSADAFAIYRGMDIGTAKPTPAQQAQIPHHLIDIREPADAFSVDDWLSLANAAIESVRSRGHLPIVVGGTHLYIKALLEGLFDGPPPDDALRLTLQSRSTPSLRQELERVDPAAAQRIHPNDRRRTIRAIEVHTQTGVPISQLQQQWDQGRRPDALLIAQSWPVDAINRRINARVKGMIEQGLVAEAEGLWQTRAFGAQSSQAIGYKQLIDHFEGGRGLDEAIEKIKIDTRRFAKNQRTWIRRLLQTTANAPQPVIIHAADSDRDKSSQDIVEQLLIG